MHLNGKIQVSEDRISQKFELVAKALLGHALA